MRQIKDGAVVARSPSGREAASGRLEEAGDPSRRLRSLLGRRARLAGMLASVDRELENLGRALAGLDLASAAPGGGAAFALRGDDALAGRFGTPASLDRGDLERRLRGIRQLELREEGALRALEILVRYERGSGRVLAIDVRRSGEARWQRRFEVAPEIRSGSP